MRSVDAHLLHMRKAAIYAPTAFAIKSHKLIQTLSAVAPSGVSDTLRPSRGPGTPRRRLARSKRSMCRPEAIYQQVAPRSDGPAANPRQLERGDAGQAKPPRAYRRVSAQGRLPMATKPETSGHPMRTNTDRTSAQIPPFRCAKRDARFESILFQPPFRDLLAFARLPLRTHSAGIHSQSPTSRNSHLHGTNNRGLDKILLDGHVNLGAKKSKILSHNIFS